MNEWSPGGNYSRPGTPSQTGRTFRSQWDESELGIKPLVVNIRSTADNRTKSALQQYTIEDSKISLTTSNKNKKIGNGVSDPRFKRVISAVGMQNDVCVGTEVKTTKPEMKIPETDATKPKVPDFYTPENKLNQQLSDSVENKESPAYTEAPVENANSNTQEAANFDQSKDHLKAVDKLLFNHDILTKSFSKESLSNSTVNTRNTSLRSDDLADEFAHELSMFPSSTRVKKVQNWIQDQKKPDKKQSVITVIGQTQGQYALSSALREIDKRRKLVKELDKYAICQKIVESDKEQEISDLVEKISSYTESKKSVFDEDKSLPKNETLSNLTPSKGNENNRTIKSNKSNKYRDASDNSQNESKTKNADASSDSLTPLSESRKRSSSKKKIKKSQLTTEVPSKGKLKDLLVHMQCQWIFCVVVVLSGALCWFMFFALQNGSYVSFDLFSQKPKKLTWYEKICNWIWELFRPSGNYQRTASWNPY